MEKNKIKVKKVTKRFSIFLVENCNFEKRIIDNFHNYLNKQNEVIKAKYYNELKGSFNHLGELYELTKDYLIKKETKETKQIIDLLYSHYGKPSDGENKTTFFVNLPYGYDLKVIINNLKNTIESIDSIEQDKYEFCDYCNYDFKGQLLMYLKFLSKFKKKFKGIN